MTAFAFPWVEASLATSLVGAAVGGVVRDGRTASRMGLTFAGGAFACAAMAGLSYATGTTNPPWVIGNGNGRPVFALDERNSPLVPLVALLHFFVALATARTKLSRFPYPTLLAGGAVRLAAFSCVSQWLLVGLLLLDVALPAFELRRRGRPLRLYLLHAGAFAVLLAAGWACVSEFGATTAGSVLLVVAVLIRCGSVPAPVWFTDLFESASFGTALLFATPLVGAYAAVRLLLPVAPEWVLEGFGVLALGSAVYAAGTGLVRTDPRGVFASLFVSHAALVLVGLALHSPFAVTGALVMGLSVSLSLTGLGLTLRAVEARVGALDLTAYRGLYDHAPLLAVCFLTCGLAAVGFPGTTGFVAIELLVDEAVGSHEFFGLAVVVTAALNGIGVVRTYLLLFTGTRPSTGVSLGITTRERVAVLAIVSLILTGGLLPQSYLESRHRAADSILRVRPADAKGPADERPQADRNGAAAR